MVSDFEATMSRALARAEEHIEELSSLLVEAARQDFGTPGWRTRVFETLSAQGTCRVTGKLHRWHIDGVSGHLLCADCWADRGPA